MAGKTYSYRAAGVDVDAGNALVERIKPLARATARPGADVALGGFGGIFDLAACGYRDPLLIAATDGVGTKLLVADAAGRHDTVGIDLVAMCVNDLVVQGAEPLFFLDYLATGRLDVAAAEAIIKGIAEGCRQAGCALIGGETAEMPGVYVGKQYDLAGFSVGAVERDRLVDGATITPGDRVLGLASSGLHSNGFSLVRRIVADQGLAYDSPAPFDSKTTLGAALLVPTRIYVRPLLAALPAGIKGLAHITGGGLLENIPRVLPDSCRAVLDATAWPLPPVFRWLAEIGALDPMDMARTFNCGIGMVVIVAPDHVSAVTKILRDAGEVIHDIGKIEPRDAEAPQTDISNLDAAWPQPNA